MNLLANSSIRWQFLADGQFQYPAALLGGSEDGDPVSLPYRSLLLESGGGRILVDTGGGPLSPSCGLLPMNLATAGIAPTSVELVFLTHAHPDHIGGLLLPDGELAFPNAQVWISGREWDYWKRLSVDGALGTGKVFGVPAIEELTHQWLQRYLFALEGRCLRLIHDEAELAPGIRAFTCPGHTPGHMAIDVAEQFIYAADLVYRMEQLAHPNATTLFDWDREVLSATRQKLIVQSREQARPLWFCHCPIDSEGERPGGVSAGEEASIG